jgi:branched-chain amino acid transport system permease protein
MGAGEEKLGVKWAPGLGPFVVALIVAMSACAAIGLVIERFAYRPLRKAPKLNILITAIGVSLLLQNGAQILFGASPKVFPNLLEDSTLMEWGDAQLRAFDVAILVVGVAFMAGLQWFVHATKIGKAMRAVSANPTAASLMGINVNKVISATFVVGSALAGVGAVLVGTKYPKIDPFMGLFIGMKAFVAAVLGGIGNIMGAVVGGLIMGLCEEFIVAYGKQIPLFPISSTYRDAFAFGILIVILLFRPAGLLGKSQVEKV